MTGGSGLLSRPPLLVYAPPPVYRPRLTEHAGEQSIISTNEVARSFWVWWACASRRRASPRSSGRPRLGRLVHVYARAASVTDLCPHRVPGTVWALMPRFLIELPADEPER